MRNNEERIGAAVDAEPPLVPSEAEMPQAGQSSFGLNFVVPTEFVELPSKGDFYPEGHPLYKEEYVEIKHMTAREEDILTSKTLLRKGVAIDRLIDSILVDKRIKAKDLLLGDKNAILVYSRIFAYGSDYSSTVVCPSCGASNKFEFNLNTHSLRHPSDVEDSGLFESLDNGNFVVSLPKTQAKVEVRLLTGADEQRLLKIAAQKKKAKIENADATLTDQMRLFIVSIGGSSDKKMINKFIEAAPAADTRLLRKIYNRLTPNLDLTQEFVCSSCGHETDTEVPITPEFFWPNE